VVAEHLADREHAVLEAQVRVQVGQELVEAAAREPAGPVGGVGLEHEPQLRPRARSAPERDVRDAGLAPSMGAVVSPYDNAMVESFSGRMQVELFNRQAWKTRIDLPPISWSRGQIEEATARGAALLGGTAAGITDSVGLH
jgi:hypothetical protein